MKLVFLKMIFAKAMTMKFTQHEKGFRFSEDCPDHIKIRIMRNGFQPDMSDSNTYIPECDNIYVTVIDNEIKGWWIPFAGFVTNEQIMSAWHRYFGANKIAANNSNIEPGILPVCDALNSIPGVNTIYSCEGHAAYLKRPYVMFTAPQELALRIHRSLGLGVGHDLSLKYCWWLRAHFQDDGSITYCLEPNDYRITGRYRFTFPAWWRNSMNRELLRLAQVIKKA